MAGGHRHWKITGHVSSATAAHFSRWTFETIQRAVRRRRRRRRMAFARGAFRLLRRFDRSKSALIAGKVMFLPVMGENNTRRNLNITLRQMIQRIATNAADQREFGHTARRRADVKQNGSTDRRVMWWNGQFLRRKVERLNGRLRSGTFLGDDS